MGLAQSWSHQLLSNCSKFKIRDEAYPLRHILCADMLNLSQAYQSFEFFFVCVHVTTCTRDFTC